MEETLKVANQNVDNEFFYKSMLRIRKTEESLLDLFSKGELFGTTHTSIGQEANAVAVLSHIKDGDVVYSNHRCHGHYLAYGGPMNEFFAEVMGKVAGVVGGRGGSQHLCFKNFYSNGIQGGIVGNAVGAALALKHKKNGNIAIVFLGDGTLGEGLVYESFNFAGLWNLPILFVIENNRYAQTTPIKKALSGSILERAKSFKIQCDEIESNDVIELHEKFSNVFEYIRDTRKPFIQIINTYRTVPHSKGDDFRNQEEIDSWRTKDPIKLIENKIPSSTKIKIYNEVSKEIEECINFARNSTYPTFNDIEFENIETISPKEMNDNFNLTNESRMNGVETLNKAFHQLLEEDEKIMFIGEDVLDPYGGAFKVAKGLSSRFANQVLTTPISEAGITALGVGLAKQGFKPIVEIMFGDFLTLTLDQLVNHASKYKWMYNNKVNIPLVIRTPMGGKRGYGPTHSQSLEKLFLGIPGLAVVAASKVYNPGELLMRSVKNNTDPILFIENKSLYTERIKIDSNNKYDLFDYKKTNKRFPTVSLSLNGFKRSDYTLITYGGNVTLAMEAAKELFIEEEIVVDIVVPSLISPLPINEIAQYLTSDKIIIVEEGTKPFGWGAEVISRLNEKTTIKQAVRLGAFDCPIPSSKPLEIELLPNTRKLIEVVKGLEANG